MGISDCVHKAPKQFAGTGGVPADLGQNRGRKHPSNAAGQAYLQSHGLWLSELVLHFSVTDSGTLLECFEPPNSEDCEGLR